MVTGREFIIFILKNHLEDENLFENGVFTNIMTVKETAAHFNVGTETINMWYRLNMLPAIEINDILYFVKGTPDPRLALKYDDKRGNKK